MQVDAPFYDHQSKPGAGDRTNIARAAWTEALTFVADTMKRGAAATHALKQEIIAK